MKASLLQENFLRAITRTGRTIPSRPQLPVVQNFLLQATKDGVYITATNLETTESTWIGAKVEKEGDVCVPAKTLSEFVSSLPAGTVHVSLIKEEFRLECEGFTAAFPTLPATEFPPVPPAGRGTEITLDKDVFVGALSRVAFAAATDEGRPILTGAKLHGEKDALILAATDGYRLSVGRVEVSTKTIPDMVIPARALQELIRVAQEEKEEKEAHAVFAKDNQLEFTIGDTRLTTRLLDGEFPKYEKIIPKSFTTRALLDRESFTRATRSASVFARDNANIVRLALEGQKLTVSANAPLVGGGSATMSAKIDGEGGEIAFNSRFLLDFLANFSDEEFLFEMTGSLNPGVFKPVKDASFLHIIMPVRVQT